MKRSKTKHGNFTSKEHIKLTFSQNRFIKVKTIWRLIRNVRTWAL